MMQINKYGGTKKHKCLVGQDRPIANITLLNLDRKR